MTLPKFIPLPEAAHFLGLTESELRERVEAGTIAAGVLPSGEIVVSEENIENRNVTNINASLRAIKRKDFEHLQGQPITVAEAAKKYSLAGMTIRDWIKIGYVTIIDPDDYPMKLNEVDVAYCVAIHNMRKRIGVRSGAPLLDKHGDPYLLKHPALSRYRRERRRVEQPTIT